MKKEELSNKFLNLRKSPTFMLVAFIGLIDFLFWMQYIFLIIIFDNRVFPTYSFIMFFLFASYAEIRYFIYKYSFVAIPILYLAEFAFKVKVENNFTENNKKYKRIWLMGVITFIIITLCSCIDHLFLAK